MSKAPDREPDVSENKRSHWKAWYQLLISLEPNSKNRPGWPEFLTTYASLVWPVVLTAAAAVLLLTQSPYLVLALLAGLPALIFLTRHPQWGVYLMVLSVPGQAYLSLSVGSSKVTFTQLAVLLALLGWFGHHVLNREALLPKPLPRLLPLFLVYLFAMVLSITVAQSISEALNELLRWVNVVFSYILACSVIKTRRQLWELVACSCAGSIIEGLIGVVQNRLQTGPDSTFLPCVDSQRACGTFVMPNSYAGYIEMGLPLVAVLALLAWFNRNAIMQKWFAAEGHPRVHLRPQIWQRHGWLLGLAMALGLVLLGILTAQSKGAFLGLAVAGLGLGLVKGRKFIPLAIIGGFILFLLVAAVQTGVLPVSTFGRLVAVDQFTPFDVRGVIVTDDNFSTVERMAMWQAGGNMFLSDPWLGVGIGNFNTRYFEFSTPRWPDSRGHAHNYYIQAAAETGIIGLAAYLALLLTALRQGWLAVRRSVRDRNLHYIAWGSFGIIVAVAFHNIVEDLHVLNMGIQWSVLLALFYLVEKQLKTELA